MKKGIIFMSLFATIVVLLQSCKKDPLDEFDVVYEVRFESPWSSATHPTDYPSNAHFSPMIGLSHQANYRMFTVGLPASDGVKDVAETGSTTALESELTKDINTGLGLFQFKGSSFDSPGSDAVELGVRAGYHTVTVISMIAPSPDWFVGATTSLIDPSDGMYYDEVIVHATSYDAGTDSGVSFASDNLPTDPSEAITILSEGPLTEGTDTVVNMGRFIFTKVK